MPWTWKASKHAQLSLWSSWKFAEWSQPECWGETRFLSRESVSPVSTQTSKLRCPPPFHPPTWMVCRLGVTPVHTRREIQRRARAEAATLRSNAAPGSHPPGDHDRAETPEGPLAYSLLRPRVQGTSGILEAKQLKWKPSSLLPAAFKDLIAPHSTVKFVPSLPLTQNSRLHASTSSSSFSSLTPSTYAVFQPICTPLVPEHTLYFLSRCLCSCRSFHLQRTFSLRQNSARSSGLSSNAAPRPAP